MTLKPTVFMFSGQGSQYFQMGRELFETDDTFRESMRRLDDLARPWVGTSVIATIYSDLYAKGATLDRLAITHPAIFMVEYSLAQSLIAAGVSPDTVLGVSLGSFAAAAVAGFVDAEEALTAVMQQADALEEWGEPGGMTAVLADPALFAEGFLERQSELVAVNSTSHFVVSARRTALAAIEADLRQRKVSYLRLPVTVPFHSRWIDRAQAPFESFVRSIRHRQGRLPLVCCNRAAALPELSGDHFWNVVRRPIRFRETVTRLEQQGDHCYIDVGPGGTLATLLKHGLPETTQSTVHAILTPYSGDLKNLAGVVASVPG